MGCTRRLDNVNKEGGAWTQVSRLGMPLVNEVVIGAPTSATTEPDPAI